jgi:RHS repeat-associated protein
LKDHLGSTRLITTSSGTYAARYDYDPYGKMQSWVNPDLRYLFTGQEWDGAVYNFRARQYDPYLAMFYAQDPAHQTFSPYGYCLGNPISFVDPTGRSEKWESPNKDKWWYYDMLRLLSDWSAANSPGANSEVERTVNDIKFRAERSWNGDRVVYDANGSAIGYWKMETVGAGDPEEWQYVKGHWYYAGGVPIPEMYEETVTWVPLTHSQEARDYLLNVGTMMGMFFNWATGTGENIRTFSNNRVTMAMSNAWKVNEARNYFYSKYSGAADLNGASVTDYGAGFGLEGVIRAGLDPIELDLTPFCRQREKPVSFQEGELAWKQTSNEQSMNGNSRSMQ